MRSQRLLSGLMLGASLLGQQVSQIDLIAHYVPKHVASVNSEMTLAGCESPFYSHFDGVIVSAESPPKLSLELALAKQTVHRGETVGGQVLLRNVGSETVVIPWSVDPKVRKHPPDAVQHEYELGWFELELIAKNKHAVTLESGSQTFVLGSSEANPETKLHLEPGQWVTAKIRFVLDETKPINVVADQTIKQGHAEIRAQWRQARYTWERNGCTVETGYFSYDYRENARPVSIEIVN